MKTFIIFSITLLNFLIALPASAGDVLYKIYGEPFEYGMFGNNEIRDMVMFEGYLYIAAYNDTPASHMIFRLKDGCNLWDDVSPPWLNVPFSCPLIMCVFKNYLYAYNGIQVFRYNGSTWSDVTGNLSAGCVNDMDELNGQLYLNGTWRIKDDTVEPHVWESVWNPQFNCPGGGGNIEVLEYFDNYLYAGIGCDAPNGIEVWRTDTGTSWTSVQEEHSINLAIGHIKGMKPFNNHLYVAPYGHGQYSFLWRTDGSLWEEVAIPIDNLTPFRFAEHNSNFYLGKGVLYHPDPVNYGKPLLYVSADGLNWNAVNEGPKFSSTIHAITSLLSHEGNLYMATTTAGQTGELAVYVLGPCPCTALKQATVSITPGSASSELFPGATHTFTVEVDAGSEFDFAQCLVEQSISIVQYGEGVYRGGGSGWVPDNGVFSYTYEAYFQGPTALQTDDIEVCISAAHGIGICSYATHTWVDTTPPDITITSPPDGAKYLLNQVVAAEYSVEDAVGVASIISTPNVLAGGPIPTGQTGIHQFTVTAEDYSNNTATNSVTYEVVTPAEGAQDLSSEVATSALPEDIIDGLNDKLTAAIDALNRGNKTAAINILNSFINMVNSQVGKTLTGAQADSWIAEAQKIIDSI